MRLPRDYRGLPRPSSAPCAKASAVRPEYLRGPRPLRLPINLVFSREISSSSRYAALRVPCCDSKRATGAGRCGKGVLIPIRTFGFAFVCLSLERR